MTPDWFFLPEEQWAPPERKVISAISQGPVLDLGCGAGRISLYLQSLGYDVTGVDMSPGALSVCKSRGVCNIQSGDLARPPADKRWGAALLMCGNLGLAGSWDATRDLFARLADIAKPGALLIGDTVDPTVTDDQSYLAYQKAALDAGLHLGHVRLRLRYGDVVTPWWDQLNFPVADVEPLVKGTGWDLIQHLVDGVDHYVVLRKSQ